MASRMFQRLVQPIGTNVIEKSFTLSHYRGTRRKSCGCRILIPVYKWHMKPFATKCRSVICIDFGSFYCAPGFPLRRAHLIIIRISSSPGIGSSHGDESTSAYSCCSTVDADIGSICYGIRHPAESTIIRACRWQIRLVLKPVEKW